MSDLATKPAVKKPIPAKLKDDAIIEAIFEIRFDTVTIPEILFGRLADVPAWRGFTQQKLPAYNIPDAMRQADSSLRYVPVFELQDKPGHRLVRIGPHVLSYHQLAPYVGWSAFKADLSHAIEVLFAKANALKVKRLGFRYLNALSGERHHISSVSDLDLNIAVEDKTIAGSVNLNFTTNLSDESSSTVRVATTDFTQGDLPSGTSLIVDVDVFTNEPLSKKSETDTKAWLEFAHTNEKEQFFRLLTHDTINALKESV